MVVRVRIDVGYVDGVDVDYVLWEYLGQLLLWVRQWRSCICDCHRSRR